VVRNKAAAAAAAAAVMEESGDDASDVDLMSFSVVGKSEMLVGVLLCTFWMLIPARDAWKA